MSVKIEGLNKFTGLWGTTYTYKGVRILRGSGRYASRYDFVINIGDKHHRILASNLREATHQINNYLGE
jgi:hypothetical protein